MPVLRACGPRAISPTRDSKLVGSTQSTPQPLTSSPRRSPAQAPTSSVQLALPSGLPTVEALFAFAAGAERRIRTLRARIEERSTTAAGTSRVETEVLLERPRLRVTTIKRGEQTIAIDVRPISAQAPEGLSDYDLQPQSTMTNAIADAVVTATGGNEITLNYKTGVVKVLVPPGTPMSQAAPGQRADVKAGETIFVAARNEGGKLTAVRVQVSKDGVKPTQ